MTWFEETRRSWYQDRGNLKENFKKIRLIRKIPAPGIRPHRDRSAEFNLNYIYRPLEKNPLLINWKKELKTVCYKLYFFFAWLSFSFIRARDQYRLPSSHAHSTHLQVSHIFYSAWNVSPNGKFLQFMQMSQVYRLDRVFFHKLHHPPCCLGNFADYGLQFHEGDRDTRSQSQNDEGPSLTSVRFRHNLPHWSISEGLIRWCLSVIMKFPYSFICW